jgi:phage FluMu protein Com
MSTFPKLPDQFVGCPKCGKQMLLARIAPHGIRQALRMFECPRCKHVEQVLVPPEPRLNPTDWRTRARPWNPR